MMGATMIGANMTGAKMTGPRSLAEMALKVVLQNASDITDLSSLPPFYTTKILKAVKTADHLHTLEVNSEDLYDQTPEHWERLIRRDFPILAARHKYEPPDPQSWYRVYEQYQKLEDDAVAAATEKLSQGFAAVKEHRDSRQSTIVSGAQARKLPKAKMVGSYSKPKPSRGCKNWLDQARKESKEYNRRFAKPKPKIMPIQKQIPKAPEWMVREAREKRIAAEKAEKAADKVEKVKAVEKAEKSVFSDDDEDTSTVTKPKQSVSSAFAAKFGPKKVRKHNDESADRPAKKARRS